MQNNEVDKAVQKCLTETSTKLVNILIAHYHAIKDQAKTNAMAVETKIKEDIEQSSNQTEWTAKWKLSRSAAENQTRKLACSYTNKRNGKISPDDTNQEVDNNTLIIEFNHSMITLNPLTEPTPPSTSEQLDMEKTKRKGRPVPKGPIQRPRRVQRQGSEQTVQRQRPTKLNRQQNRTLNKKRHIYKRKYKDKHVITTSNNTDNILNLSTYTLTQHELSILSKGLSFIPKIKSLNIEELTDDVTSFENRMTLALKRHLERNDHNKSVTRSNTAETPIIPDNMRDRRESFKKFRKFKPITNIKPPVGSTLRTYLDNIKDDLLTPNELQQNNKDNITKQERLAIKTLAENTAIVINKADKGSTIVVLGRQHYIAEGNKHLSDTNTYRPLTMDITSQTKDKINKILTQMKKDGFLTKVYTDYCRPPSEHRTSRLYFLKKIHKNPMGIRPIVSSTNSITENISAFVDHWLQPFVNKLSSHIKDTNEFIKLIENTKVPTDCLLVSIDVSSLYTNIPHSEGKAAAVDYLSTNTSDPVQPEPEVIGELISLVVENNVFEFNDKHYLQTQGTAMGTKMAPAYANLFMGKIENKLQAMTDKIFIWKRFIDDIFIIWTGTNMELEQFIHKANSMHETIKFTFEVDETNLTFLDTTVYKGPTFTDTNTLDIKTHIKATNKQLYVQATSYHPLSCKEGIYH